MDTRILLKTAYLTSATSYLVFLTLEWLRPGFVSSVFSPHLFLASAVVCGILWGRMEYGIAQSEYGIPVRMIGLVLGLLLAVVIWTEGRSLEEFRILVTAVALILPSFVLHSLCSHSKF